jgi:hypothetical protein
VPDLDCVSEYQSPTAILQRPRNEGLAKLKSPHGVLQTQEVLRELRHIILLIASLLGLGATRKSKDSIESAPAIDKAEARLMGWKIGWVS